MTTTTYTIVVTLSLPGGNQILRHDCREWTTKQSYEEMSFSTREGAEQFIAQESKGFSSHPFTMEIEESQEQGKGVAA